MKYFLLTLLILSGISFAQKPKDSLPVELVYFEGSVNNDTVKLIWGTATEVNNYGFNIERSIDEENWETIDFVFGSGTSSSPKDYFYNDTSIVSTGVYFYRLKQIDIDGDYEYSWIISIDFITGLPEMKEKITTDFSLFQNYPNPFNPSTTISFEIAESGNIQLEIINSLGEKVDVVYKGYMSAGIHKFNFNASGLTSGVYFYRLKSLNHSLIKKMILLR